ncbi:LysR family transcriptional regulator, partial [Spirillospora sp. NPDC029432]|uniref:LysR family transcriptional regulator n=1 Tax=Spirillospora sp. NPDC029432 TaxID=3154599 RepID=UPI003456AB00
MSGLEIGELEAFLALADELHFGRAGERLYLSQSRVSQLIRSLESRVGARLVERTSRRVRLTPLGERLLADARPAYDDLRAALDGARAAARGVGGVLRIGFQGTANDQVMAAVAAFQSRHPDSVVEIVEIPFTDPFGPVRRDEVDAAVVLLPMEEDDLVLGRAFSEQPQTVAVASGHPFAGRAGLDAEELAGLPLIGVGGPAPEYWRRAQAPLATPNGAAIPRGPVVGTLQEGLAMVAAGRGALLLCRGTAAEQGRRGVAFVEVGGLPPSVLGLVWHRDRENARTRAFAAALADAGAACRPWAGRPPPGGGGSVSG